MQAPGGLGRTRAEQWVHMALRRGTAGCVKMGMAFCYLLNHIDRKTGKDRQKWKEENSRQRRATYDSLAHYAPYCKNTEGWQRMPSLLVQHPAECR